MNAPTMQNWLSLHNAHLEMQKDIDALRFEIQYAKNGLRFHANHDFYRDYMLERRIEAIEAKLGIDVMPFEKLSWLLEHKLTDKDLARAKIYNQVSDK